MRNPLTIAVMFAPLLWWGSATAVALLRRQRTLCRKIASATYACSTILTLATLLCISLQVIPSSETWNFGILLRDVGTEPIRWSFRVDLLGTLSLLVVSLLGWGVQLFQTTPNEESRRSNLLALIGLAWLLILAADFFMLLMFWGLLTIAGLLFRQRPRSANVGPPNVASARSSLLTVLLLCDVGLYLAVLLLWTSFGSFDMETVLLPAIVNNVATVNPAAISAIGSLALLAVWGRLALFPWSSWWSDVWDGRSAEITQLAICCYWPTGIYLLFRLLPLLSISEVVHQSLALGGLFSALLLAIQAAASARSPKYWGFLFGVQCSWIVAGFGWGAYATSWCFFCVQALLAVVLIVLLPANRTESISLHPVEKVVLMIAALLLGSGLAGQAALISDLSAAESGPPFSWRAGYAGGLQAVGLLTVGIFAFALYRGIAGRLSADDSPSREHSIGVYLLAVAGFGGAILGLFFPWLLSPASATNPPSDLLTVMAVVLIGLLGGLAAWLLEMQSDGVRHKLNEMSQSLMRLGTKDFYFRHFVRLAIIAPFHAITKGLGWCDRRLLRPVFESGTPWVCRQMCIETQPLQNGLIPFHLLSVALCLATLLGVLCWIQSTYY